VQQQTRFAFSSFSIAKCFYLNCKLKDEGRPTVSAFAELDVNQTHSAIAAAPNNITFMQWKNYRECFIQFKTMENVFFRFNM